MTAPTRGRIVFIPYGEDPVRFTATDLAARIPDHHYGRAAVIVASNAVRHDLYRLLLTHRPGAIVPPFVGTWEQWSMQLMPERRSLDRRVAELILEEQLDRNTDAVWRSALGASLLSLFDELALSNPGDETYFDAALHRGYGTPLHYRPVSDEARLVANAWHHWRAFIAERYPESDRSGDVDIARLAQAVQQYTAIYWLMPARIAPLQARLLRAISASVPITLILPGDNSEYANTSNRTVTTLAFAVDNYPHSSPRVRSAFLGEVYAVAAALPLAPRAHRFACQYPKSPVQGDLTLVELPALDYEAHAIDLQIREWWLQGKRRIAVVTFDRKLARRVRALLERGGLELHDATGWPLSTTSAASLIGLWLDAVEQNFPVAAVAALLASPLLHDGPTLEQRKQIAGRWLVTAQRARIFRGLRAQGALAQLHLAEDDTAAPLLTSSLQILEQASAALVALQLRRTRRSVFVATLIESLRQLDTADSFYRDPAGRAIRDELEAMRAAALNAQQPIEWSEFRRWLRRRLEIGYFEPPVRHEGVALLTLPQAELSQFEAAVLANVSEESLANVPSTPFFNDAVRVELGLSTSHEQRHIRLRQLRGVLDRNGEVLMTMRLQDEGRRLTLARWVERLVAFHRIAYGDELKDHRLEQHARLTATWIARAESNPELPTPTSMPQPPSPPHLVPTAFSASSLQQLIDCPYQFFVARQLGLTASDDGSDAFGKRDYGEHVHKILEAFHIGVAGLPGPQTHPVTAANASDARALLEQISDQVFAPNMTSSFLVRGWRSRWQRMIPEYLEWLQRRSEWIPTYAETRLERTLDSGTRLVGRVDRIDRCGAAIAVIDYKTGTIPKREAVEQCEQIQLPFYALLAGNLGTVATVSYLALDRAVREQTLNRDNGLDSIAAFLEQRVEAFVSALKRQVNLPAWADAATCAYCDFGGVCRRELWTYTEPRPDLASELGQKKGGL